MTDISDSLLVQEVWISLSQAAKLFPPARRGRPVSASCIWRWFKEGVQTPDGRRVHLETLRVVNRFVTSEAAVRRFILAQQQTIQSRERRNSTPTIVPRTPKRRMQADERAARQLDASGL